MLATQLLRQRQVSHNAAMLFRMQQMRYFAAKVIPVPQMGDSITEGTI